MTTDQKVQMDAFAVSLQARVGMVEAHRVDRLLHLAQTRLRQDDPLRRAVTNFAAEFPAIRRDSALLCDAGLCLRRAVELSATPVPPSLDRSDIHG